VTDYIPPTRFNLITGAIIASTLIVGILVPDIELVLGLVGSTMGKCLFSVRVVDPGLV
jgi:sodium-coupled neutral amino acid transporter 10